MQNTTKIVPICNCNEDPIMVSGNAIEMWICPKCRCMCNVHTIYEDDNINTAIRALSAFNTLDLLEEVKRRIELGIVGDFKLTK